MFYELGFVFTIIIYFLLDLKLATTYLKLITSLDLKLIDVLLLRLRVNQLNQEQIGNSNVGFFHLHQLYLHCARLPSNKKLLALTFYIIL